MYRCGGKCINVLINGGLRMENGLGCRIQDAGCKMRDTGCGMKDHSIHPCLSIKKG